MEYDQLTEQQQWVKDSKKYDPAATSPLLGAWGKHIMELQKRIDDLEVLNRGLVPRTGITVLQTTIDNVSSEHVVMAEKDIPASDCTVHCICGCSKCIEERNMIMKSTECCSHHKEK